LRLHALILGEMLSCNMQFSGSGFALCDLYAQLSYKRGIMVIFYRRIRHFYLREQKAIKYQYDASEIHMTTQSKRL
ncbi:hypothetical protein NDU88_008251, partial [Pleurodeles waltl]